MTGDFHFIRPEFLLLLVPAAGLFWLMAREGDPARHWNGVIAPHLLKHLLTGPVGKRRFKPVHLIGLGWLIAIVAVAGPAWRLEPAPFADDTAALALVLKVSPSMKTEDVQPDRLTRSKQKIHDLLEMRKGAKTALVAYAGTAHTVIPPTTDGGIINSFAESLEPDIMPGEGDEAAAALRRADENLSSAGGGSIVWITDAVSPGQARALAEWRKASATPLRILAPLPAGTELNALRAAAAPLEASLVLLSPDDADVKQLARDAKYAGTAEGAGDHWQESGYWLTPVLGLLMLAFFRRGWMVDRGVGFRTSEGTVS